MGNVFVPALITGADLSCFERSGVVSTRGGGGGREASQGLGDLASGESFPESFKKQSVDYRKLLMKGGCNPLNPPWIRLCVIVREKKTSASKNDKEKCT